MNHVTTPDRVRRNNSKIGRYPGQIVALLKNIGVPKQMLYVRRLSDNGSFWSRGINHLQVLEQVRRLYRQQIVCVHPDKAGGCAERTVQLNGTWDKIERRFKAHGHELW
jgi:hypothetical protein